MAGRTYIIGSFNVCDLSYGKASNEKIYGICDIIKKEQIDIVALQEVLDPNVIKNRIMPILGSKWDFSWAQSHTRVRPGAYEYDSRGGEGYAFIWNRYRLKKVERLSGGSYEPVIYNQYKVNSMKGQQRLIRDPLYGRFTPRDLGGGNFEIRLICTHIRFSANDTDNTFYSTMGNNKKEIVMRQKELEVLSQNLYPKIEDKIYGVMMPAYTILLGDYNLNLKRSWTNQSCAIEREFVPLPDGKEMITVQDQLTTLKKPRPDDPDMSKRGYANNYDHFTYDRVRLLQLNPRPQRVDVIGRKGYDRYFGDFDKYRGEVSDHIPIIIKLTPNEYDL